MGAARMSYITCDTQECTSTFPASPVPVASRAESIDTIRDQAASKGWKVAGGREKNDICPPCQINHIKAAAGIDVVDTNSAPIPAMYDPS